MGRMSVKFKIGDLVCSHPLKPRPLTRNENAGLMVITKVADNASAGTT